MTVPTLNKEKYRVEVTISDLTQEDATDKHYPKYVGEIYGDISTDFPTIDLFAIISKINDKIKEYEAK